VESGFAENGLIAFAHGEGGLADISVVSPDGSGRKVLVASDADELWPAWSPDGTKIAYTTDESGMDRESMAVFSHGDIVVMNADGSAPISITERYDGVPDPHSADSWKLLKSDDWDPTWSPDGEEIAYMGVIAPDTWESSDALSDIYVVKSDGSARRNLTNTSDIMEVAPEWSPSGSRIAFISVNVLEFMQKGTFSLSLIDTDGSDRQEVTKLTWFPFRGTNGYLDWIYGLSWSPDGTKIAFADSAQSSDAVHVFVMNADGSERQDITHDHPGASLNPAWSPDGRKIAFITDRDGDEALYIMEADGSKPHRVTGSNTRLGFPDWQPIPASS
jgi:Tol biopolymer transport system component